MSDTGIVRIHGKEYQTVGKRINDFRANYPEYEINTEVLSAAELILIKATIKNSQGQVIATGHAEEERGSTNINRTSAVENAETSAVGRCLAFMGLGGTQIASADEVANAVTQQGQKEIYDRMVKFTRSFASNYSSVEAIKTYLSSNELDLAKEAWNEIPQQEQMDLWLATSKGGCFTTEERKLLKGA